jgi:hypothetical protein
MFKENAMSSVGDLIGRNRDDRRAKDSIANLPALAVLLKHLSRRLAAPRHLRNRFVFARIKWLTDRFIRSRRFALHHGEQLAMNRGDPLNPRLALQTFRK